MMLRKFLKSLYGRIAIIFTVIIFVISIFSVAFFGIVFKRYARESVAANFKISTSQAAELVKETFHTVENASEHFFASPALQEWLANPGEKSADDSSDLIAKLKLDDTLRQSLLINSAWQEKVVDSAYFFFNKSCFCFFSQGNQNLEALTQKNFDIFEDLNSEENPLRSGQMIMFAPTPEGHTMYFARYQRNHAGMAPAMTLIFSVEEDTLFRRFQAATDYPECTAYLVDREGVIYSARDKSLLGQKIDEETAALPDSGELETVRYQGRNCYTVSKTVSDLGFRLVIAVPVEELNVQANELLLRYLAFMALMFLLLWLVTMLFVRGGKRVIQDITENLNEIKNGNFKNRLPSYSTTELSVLSQAFNSMADQIDYLIYDVYEQQLALKKVNLQFLQSQINPHFLLNTFAAIEMKAKLANQETIYNMVKSLSMLMQAGLQRDAQNIIALGDELEYVKSYLYIQSVRFGERLNYRISIQDDRLLKAKVPRLSVEPVVENAVVHGLENLEENGLVEVSITASGADLTIIVRDNGVGFPAGVKRIADIVKTDGEGSVGLRNTQKRFELLYNSPDYGLFIDTSVEKGAKVMIRLPLEMEGEGNV